MVAPSLRSVTGNDSGTSQVSTRTVAIPAGTPVGTRAYVWAAWNASDSALSIAGGAGGWTPEALQSPSNTISARLWRKDVEAADVGATITVTSPLGSGRCAIGLALVNDPPAGSFTTPVFSTSAGNVSSHAIPGVDPDTAALVLSFATLNLAAGSGGVTPPASGWTERLDSITTNGSGRRIGVWCASYDTVSDAAVAATTYSTTQLATDLTWVVAIQEPAAPTGPAATWWDGTSEVPAEVTWWDGTAEVPAAIDWWA